MLVNGKMICPLDKAISVFLMVTHTKEKFIMVNSTELEKKHRIISYTQETLLMVIRKEKLKSNIQMVIYIREKY